MEKLKNLKCLLKAKATNESIKEILYIYIKSMF